MHLHLDNTQKHDDKGKTPSQIIGDITDQVVSVIKSKMTEIGDSGALIVNIGETHSNPYHIVAQTDIMNALLDQRIPFICALEREGNKVSTALSEFSRIKDIPKSIDRLKESNMFKQFEQSALVRAGRILDGPLAHTMQLDFLKKNGIAYQLVDANRQFKKGQFSLDLSDDSTKQSLAEAEDIMGEHTSAWRKILQVVTTPEPIELDSTKGALTRNIHMLKACEELSQNVLGVKLILLFTGAAHTRGHTGAKNYSPATHSLPHLSKKSFLDFVGVDLSHDKAIPDFGAIQNKLIDTPSLPINFEDLFIEKTDEVHLGLSGVEKLKSEEKKISALTLAWLAPYKDKLLDLYLQKNIEFEDGVQHLTRLEQ